MPASSTALRSAAYRSLAAAVANTSTTPPVCERLAQRLGALGEEEPLLGPRWRRASLRAALTRPLFAESGVVREAAPGSRVAVRRQAVAGALTSSGRAALAISTSAAKAGASLTARSARILRSTSTPARP